MTTVALIAVFLLASSLELIIYGGLWRYRQLLYPVAIALAIVASVGLIVNRSSLLLGLILILCFYRLASYLRIFSNRLTGQALFNRLRSASLVIITVQLASLGLNILIQSLRFSPDGLWLLFGLLSFLLSLGLLIRLPVALSRIKPIKNDKYYSDRDLPSVTVALPARNETSALEQSLDAILASDYPKLEIIVLDDCSQNKRTPEIIRGYAQRGVRFLAGSPPPKNWLAKNHALQQLADAASGQYIIFLGVDIILNKRSIRRLTTELLASGKTMLSIIPMRDKSAKGHLALAQAMRYIWELMPPRRLFNRPPILSSCLIIDRSKLVAYGAFKGAQNSVTPEAYLARSAIIDNDGYRFSRSNGWLSIKSSKSTTAQRLTALRVRYPQLHKKIELVALFSLIEIILLLMPFVVVLLGFMIHLSLITWLAALASCLMLMTANLLLSLTTGLTSPLTAIFSFPMIIINDLLLVHLSAYRYEFSEIEWKGRNICQPVMQVIPHLPRLR